ncbi:MAG: penicillin-binding transpeptidase domain-containing protein [Mycobacteriales bacterium]
MQSRHRPATLVTCLVLVALAPACTSPKGKKDEAKPSPTLAATLEPSPTVDPEKPDDVARRFFELWQLGDFAGAALLTDAVAVDVVEAHDATAQSLKATTTKVSVNTVEVAGQNAVATFTVTYDLPGLGEWSYDNEVPLQQTDGKWSVQWTPAVVYPSLLAGQRLARTRSLPERGEILDAAGKPLFGKSDRITVGIEPRRLATDPTSMYAQLAALTKSSPAAMAALKKKVTTTKPTGFVPLITYPEKEFIPLKPKLSPLPGVIFQRDSVVGSVGGFARPVLGRVGDATAEILDNAGGQFQAGDRLGLSGLQLAFQTRLTGTPIGEIVIKTGTTTVESVKQFAGEAPLPVKTTLDTVVQAAAEKALGAIDKPAALVAVRASTGEILAVANRPENNSFNRAFVGRYPPGSTMKVISSAALLKSGLRTNETVACPPKFVVFGKTFRNFKGEALGGQVPFSTDFAHSCNTAFVSLADRLAGAALPEMAEAFGVGRDWKLPLPAFTGSMPLPKDKTELAASMIGQGQVLVSPLNMAMAAAAVASGTWKSPVLVTDPPAEKPQQVTPIPPAIIASLRVLMRQVVTEGTGKAAETPGKPVSGKTGTAEFGSKPPFPTHAWFVGFRGDVAVAVIVEGGGTGGQVAAPIVGAFFTHLP